MLDRKDELARVAPDLVPLPDDGPLVERPVASTDGAGDHPLASIDEATDNGRWVAQRVVDAPRTRWRVLIVRLAPLEVLVERDAPVDARRVIAAALDAARPGLDSAPLGLEVELAGDLILQVTVIDVEEDDTGDLEAIPMPPLLGPLPVPTKTATWDLDDGIAVHGRGTLLALDPIASYVWAANADGMSVADIAEESEGGVDATAVVRMLADWRRRGVLDDDQRRPPAARTKDVGAWNLGGHYRVLGRTIRVAVPSQPVIEWIAGLLSPAQVTETDDVDGTVIVSHERNGWRVDGRWVPSEHQVAALVRAAVLRVAAAVNDRASIEASALAGANGAVVVLGPKEVRREMLVAWLRIGGRVLADGALRLDESGTSVEPCRIGLAHRSGYQWIDGEPAAAGRPGAPIVSRSGELLTCWTAPTTACVTQPLPVRMVVLPGEPASDLVAARRTDALGALLAAQIDSSLPIGRPAARSLVHLARDVPAALGPLEAPAVVTGALRDNVLRP